MEFEQALQTLDLPERDEDFRLDVYRALCNSGWTDGHAGYTCSWRSAGGIVAELVDEGEDYLDYYCAGGEGEVAEEVRSLLADQGWVSCSWEEASAISYPKMAAKYLGQLQFQRFAREHNVGHYSQCSGPDGVRFECSPERIYVLDCDTGSVSRDDRQILPPVDTAKMLAHLLGRKQRG